MKGEEFVGYPPEDIRWHPDNQTILFSWNPENEILRSTYQWKKGMGNPQKVEESELAKIPSIGDYDKEREKMIYAKNGDLFIYFVESGKITRLTHTSQSLRNPTFLPGDSSFTYQYGDDLYKWDLNQGKITQLIEFQSGSPKEEAEPSKHEKWLQNDQMELFEVLRDRKSKMELRDERRKELDADEIYNIYTGKKSVSGQKVCPNERFITYRLTEQPSQTLTEVPNYVTESGHVEILKSRPKVGHPQSTHQLWIYDTRRDTHYMVDTEQIPDIRKKPEFLKEYHSDPEAPFVEYFENPREVVMHGPFYSNDGKAVVVVRSLDNKDRWIMKLLAESGELIALDHQRDEAWIGGPGISNWNFTAGNVGWLKDDQHFWFQSEESGYSHLYLVNWETQEKKALTSGNWEILSAELSHDGKQFFVTANRESPHEHHFYHLNISDGNMEKITKLKGGHQVELSPDQSQLAVRYSHSNLPWELFHMWNESGAEKTQLTQSTTSEFQSYDWRIPEIIQFEARDGEKIPARLYQPEEHKNNGAAVIFVHGAGYLQNVHHWWSSYYREYMFHNILTDNGYTVLDIDFRASAGYGRDWRTSIYRHMGGNDLTDQVDGAKWLVENQKVNKERIGIYGGSYGGFITIMGMFLNPETFAAGAALRSVTDWAHYNHGYTSNILNTPIEDSIAFKRSSPIYHAEGHEGPLLMLHGLIDINVQYQDVVRLAQRLIELEKENWELSVFPLEGHGFIEGTSWSDEYRRIFYHFEAHLNSE